MEGFAELYRTSAADVYAYVATLLGEPAALLAGLLAAALRAARRRRREAALSA